VSLPRTLFRVLVTVVTLAAVAMGGLVYQQLNRHPIYDPIETVPAPDPIRGPHR
jgi:ABC-type Fe3+-siderophore transport system permease subunit